MHRVKLKTLITRINRQLSKNRERLCKARPNEVRTLGDYYLMDRRSMMICRCRVEPTAFAVERGILRPDEVVEIETSCSAPPPRAALRVAAARNS